MIIFHHFDFLTTYFHFSYFWFLHFFFISVFLNISFRYIHHNLFINIGENEQRNNIEKYNDLK